MVQILVFISLFDTFDRYKSLQKVLLLRIVTKKLNIEIDLLILFLFIWLV